MNYNSGYVVTFMVNATGAVVEKAFQSYDGCRKFVNKLRFSKKLTLISHPTFNY